MTISGMYEFLRETAGGMLAKAGKSTTADESGRVPDLDGPVDRAIRRAGVIPADDAAPTDVDLAGVHPGLAPYVQALAAAETFAACAGWLVKVDQALGPSNQKLSQYAAQAMVLAKWWEDRATALSPSGPASSCGVVGPASSVMDPVPMQGAGGLISRHGYASWGGQIP